VFTRYDDLVGDEQPPMLTLPAARSRVAEAHKIYQAARYDDVIGLLPDLLAGVEGLPGSAKGATRREALLSYVSAYVVAAKLVTKLGAGDLAILTADRAAHAAVEAESLSDGAGDGCLPGGLRPAALGSDRGC
jgi:hypothetical protein